MPPGCTEPPPRVSSGSGLGPREAPTALLLFGGQVSSSFPPDGFQRRLLGAPPGTGNRGVPSWPQGTPPPPPWLDSGQRNPKSSCCLQSIPAALGFRFLLSCLSSVLVQECGRPRPQTPPWVAPFLRQVTGGRRRAWAVATSGARGKAREQTQGLGTGLPGRWVSLGRPSPQLAQGRPSLPGDKPLRVPRGAEVPGCVPGASPGDGRPEARAVRGKCVDTTTPAERAPGGPSGRWCPPSALSASPGRAGAGGGLKPAPEGRARPGFAAPGPS